MANGTVYLPYVYSPPFAIAATEFKKVHLSIIVNHRLNKIHFAGEHKLARSNYKSNKRQKELARKKKKEEKNLRKLEKKNVDGEIAEAEAESEVEPSELEPKDESEVV